MRTGHSVSLARPLRGGDYNSTAERPGVRHETWYHPAADGTGWGQDHLVLNPHGLQNTHLDALNHVAVDGTFYGGRPVTAPEQGSVDVLAPHGLLTRALYVNIPHQRGTAWADRPVDGADIDAALSAAGLTVEPGDALCLDMGRDLFEAAAAHPLGGPETGDDAGGGLSSDGARWVAEHRISMVALSLDQLSTPGNLWSIVSYMFPVATAIGLGGFTVVEPGVFPHAMARFCQSYIYPRRLR
ncbi:MAG TPA: cyclase family protein [Trebonia sp.]